MSQQKIIQAIRKAANESGIKLSLDPSTFDSTLKSLNVDSLNAMSIIINVEKALNTRLPDEDLANLKTLGDLIRSFEKVTKQG
ncbi:MAG: phosphopantetheine-binding protein [Mycoplasmataceae bacterium]|jgi:acyl carrier protein|nr:phosphopantetheine-binding protein [Mycoplasmataceae bacterium]